MYKLSKRSGNKGVMNSASENQCAKFQKRYSVCMHPMLVLVISFPLHVLFKYVKIIGKEVKDGKVKISLSMKCVNQGSGADIDPNNVALDQDERRKRMFKDFTTQKITLEAVLNTLCKKCGCKGHFAKDCFMQPGGVKYSLIPDDEVELANCSSQSECQPPKKKKKVREKEQKKSKEKKTSSKSSSDTSDTNSDQVRVDIQRHKHSKKTQKSHKKKHKKHKHKRSKKKE
ncbi:uncharacterized protein LOC144607424 [Rhinoraja longicauda]